MAEISMTDEALVTNLDFIARLTQHAINFDRGQRDREGLPTDADTKIYAWPDDHSHGQLENWVKVFQAAAERIKGGVTTP